MSTTTKHLGNTGEQFVAETLQQQGFTIAAHNYQKQAGEIDVIACKKDLVVFVEVKTRTSFFCDTGKIITPTKQKKIATVAKHFLATHTQYEDKNYRFDVAFVQKKENTFDLTYIPDAFQAHE